MAKKKEKAAAKEETVQAIEGELEDEEVADDNSPGKCLDFGGSRYYTYPNFSFKRIFVIPH